MPKPNVIYNCQGLFVGPAPETGYNFVHYTGGAPTNDHSDLYQKINSNFSKAKGFKKKLIENTVEIGKKRLLKNKLV